MLIIHTVRSHEHCVQDSVVVTPHAQRERGKVIDRGVHIYMFRTDAQLCPVTQPVIPLHNRPSRNPTSSDKQELGEILYRRRYSTGGDTLHWRVMLSLFAINMQVSEEIIYTKGSSLPKIQLDWSWS